METIVDILFQKYNFHTNSVWYQSKLFFPQINDSDTNMSHFCIPADLENNLRPYPDS